MTNVHFPIGINPTGEKEGDDYWIPLSRLSRAPWISVISMTLTDPPAKAPEGDTYLVPPGATGVWAGQEGMLAQWHYDWTFAKPADGHGISLPDGRIFELVNGSYIEKVALDAQSGKWSYAVAGGTANALTATLDPAPPALVAGMMIVLKLTATNTGPVTLDVNGLGTRSVVFRDGRVLSRYCLTKAQFVELIYDGASWVMANEATGPAVQPVVYVRPDGDDNNSGEANTPAGALQTIAAAIAKLNSYVLPAEGGIIQLGIPGTYINPPQIYAAGTLTLVGDVTQPEDYIIANTPGDTASPLALSSGRAFIHGVHLKNVCVGQGAFGTTYGGWATCTNTIFETTVDAGYLCSAQRGSFLEISSGCVIRGPGLGAFYAGAGSVMVISAVPGTAVTLENAVYSDACARAELGSCISRLVPATISGNATGRRYICATNGVMNTGDENFFPGAIPGTTETGGQYS